MNISSVASLDKLAKEIVQVRITEKPKGTKRVVREDTKEFLEVGVLEFFHCTTMVMSFQMKASMNDEEV